jgi:Spy/CpxP family protein refolding chaperone
LTIRLFSALCALFLSSPLLYAQQSYHEFEKGLNLTEDQRVQVDAIKRKYMAAWRALNDASAEKRLELRELNPHKRKEWERAARLERELDQIEASKQRLFSSYRGEISTVFNNEQRGRFNRFTEQENRRAAGPVRPTAPWLKRRFYER